MAKYRLREGCGTHAMENPKWDGRDGKSRFLKMKPGDIIETDLPMTEMYENKFELIADASRPVVDPPANFNFDEITAANQAKAHPKKKTLAEPEGETHYPDGNKEEGEEEYTPIRSNLGEDVTTLFPGAASKGLHVLQDTNGHCWVTSKRARATPLHKAAFEQRDVVEFVENYNKD